MTRDEFARRVLSMETTLYHVAATLLRSPCDQEDAVQEAILQGWKHHHRLRDDGAFPAWMIRILINASHSIGRRKQREIMMDQLPDAAAPPPPASVYSLFIGLDEKYRLPMVLHYVEGYDVAQVAAMLHRPENTIKSQLLRGRKLLRQLLDMEV